MSLDQHPKDLVIKPLTRVNISDYQKIRILGQGAFGTVWLVKDTTDNSYKAFKALTKEYIIQYQQTDHIKNEVDILSSIEGDFFVKMLGICQDSKYLYILMEFVAGGEFFGYLRIVGRIHPDQAAFYISQVVLMFE